MIRVFVDASVLFLVGLDRAHLVDVPKVAEDAGIPVLVPGELLRIIRNQTT